MKIKIKYAIFFVALVLSAILIYSFIPNNKPDENSNPEMSDINYDKLNEVFFEVRTENVIKGELDKKVSANGIVKAYKELDITANRSGYIDQISIFEGKNVSKNDLLIHLDDRDSKLDLKEAEIKLEATKIQMILQKKEIIEDIANNKVIDLKSENEKLEKRFENGEINKDEYIKLKDELETKYILSGGEREKYIEIKSGLTEAKNNYERAKLNLLYSSIFSPFNGIISDLDLVEGKRINAGDILCRLLEVDKVKLDVNVLENEISLIQVGNEAEIRFNAIQDDTFNGRIIYINPAIDPQTKTCRVTVELQNRGNKIKPGMFTIVNLYSQKLTDRILVPKSALLVRDKRNLVFVQEGDLAKWRYVDIGEQNEKFVEIKSGVVPGEKVITEGHFNLAHDAKIKVLEN